MKMKLTSVFFAVAFAIMLTQVNRAQAQNFYGGLSVGYGMRMGGNDIESSTSMTNQGSDYDDNFDPTYYYDQSSTSERIKLSLGRGTQLGLMFGYMFSPNVGFELGLSYLKGGTTEITSASSNSSDYLYTGGNVSESSSQQTTQFYSNMFRVIPTLVVSAGGDKLSPYAKIGVVIGSGKVNEDITYTSYTEGYDYFSDSFYSDAENGVLSSEYSSGLSTGMTGALGLKSTTASGWSFFGELFMEYVNFSPKMKEIITYEVNGMNELPFLTTSETETEYVDSVSENNSAPANEFQPDQQLKQSWSFSNIGIRCGIIKNF
jgi:hypothetical protein